MGQKLSANFSGEKAVAFIEKFTTAFHHTDSCVQAVATDMNTAFKNKQLIFLLNSLTAASTTLRDADFRYGVLQSPKWDEAQENYITTASYTGSMYAIPRDAKDPDISSAVIEALASEGYYRVAPEFFETALKVKYSSDDDSARMYDIIKGSVMYDFGRVYSMAGLDGIPGLMRSMAANDNTNWASEVASKKAVLEGNARRACRKARIGEFDKGQGLPRLRQSLCGSAVRRKCAAIPRFLVLDWL